MKFFTTARLLTSTAFLTTLSFGAGHAQIKIQKYHLVYRTEQRKRPKSLTLEPNSRRIKSVKQTQPPQQAITAFVDAGQCIQSSNGDCLDISSDGYTITMNPCTNPTVPHQVFGWKPVGGGKNLLESYGDPSKRCVTMGFMEMKLVLTPCNMTNPYQLFDTPFSGIYAF